MAEGGEFARAKVNLTLHVTGRRPDGYHLLDSLVVFPEIGDRLCVEPAQELTLELDGGFVGDLGVGPDNLVLRAAEMMRPPGQGAALFLTKNLPVASGIGGGSADAAATLRLMSRHWNVPVPPLPELLKLGADIPVCLHQRAARMSGIGDVLHTVPVLPEFWLVLVNACIPVATGAVFAGLENPWQEPMPDLPDFPNLDALVGFLAAMRNDLEPAALDLAPETGAVLGALRAVSTCRLARMSGSGGTCFGVFDSLQGAQKAADVIAAANPFWWVAVSVVPPCN